MPTLPICQFSLLCRPFLPLVAAGLLLAANGSLQGQVVTRYDNRSLFQAAAPSATLSINFERGLASGTGTGSLGDFTELGFVTFHSGSNYTQQIVDGFNLAQGGNDLYVSQALDKSAPTANVTFGPGVFELGFEFKNTSNGPFSAGLIPQEFTFNLFSGTMSLGSFISPTIPDGTTLKFLGFTSNTPITGLTIVATIPNASPNLDIVLDNFLVSSPVPEPGTTAFVGLGLLGLVAARFFRRRTN